MLRNIFIIVVFLFFAKIKVFGQDVTVESRLDTNAMLIGDQVQLKLSIKIPTGYSVIWPSIPDSLLGHIKVLNRSKIDTALAADKTHRKLTASYLLTTFDSGFYAIPSVRFYAMHPPDTTKFLFQTDPAFLNVHSVKVDTTQAIKPIKGPLKVPLSFRDILPWLFAGLIVILIGLGIFYYIKKRKKSEPLFSLKPKIVLLPYETALSEIESLRLKKLWQSGRVKEYHSELTEIIRKYIEGQFGIMAMEMTSDEIMDAIRNLVKSNGNITQRLQIFLTMADLVKFAKAEPLPAEHEQSMEDALRFVNDTKFSKENGVMNPELETPVAVSEIK